MRSFCQHSQSWDVNEADLKEDRNKGNQSSEKIKCQKFGRVWGWDFPYLSPLEITRKCEAERSKSFFSLLSQTTVGVRQDRFQLMAFQGHWSTLPEDTASDEAAFPNTTLVCPHFSGEQRRALLTTHRSLTAPGSTGPGERMGLEFTRTAQDSAWPPRCWSRSTGSGPSWPRSKFWVQHLIASYLDSITVLNPWPCFPYLKMRAMPLFGKVISTFEELNKSPILFFSSGLSQRAPVRAAQHWTSVWYRTYKELPQRILNLLWKTKGLFKCKISIESLLHTYQNVKLSRLQEPEGGWEGSECWEEEVSQAWALKEYKLHQQMTGLPSGGE